MAFDTFLYCGILLGTMILYYLFPRKLRWTVLLAVSVAYYYVCAGKYLLLLFFSTGTVYLAARGMEYVNRTSQGKIQAAEGEEKKALKKVAANRKKMLLVLVVVLNAGILIIRKYYVMAADMFNWGFSHLGIPVSVPMRTFTLSLGISFYTLQAIGYLIDVHRGKYKAETHLGKLMLFLWFFPIMVEGPICRFDQTGEQLYRGNDFQMKNVLYGSQRIAWGMFKKMVIADRLDILVNQIMANYLNYSGIFIPVVMLAYTVQLYAEFSGAMDMVIGGAELFGIHLPENFSFPFAAKTVQEYWRRWHITLGSWFKDYIFYSVSLSAPVKAISKPIKKKWNNYYTKLTSTFIALFVVWSMTGLWHGGTAKYLVYGWYYFIIIVLGICVEPLAVWICKRTGLDRESKGYHCFQRARTFVFINAGLMLFRCGSVMQFFHMLRSIPSGFSLRYLFDGTMLKLGLDYMDYLVLLIGIMALIVVNTLKYHGVLVRDSIAGRPIAVRWAVYYVLVISILVFGAYGAGYATVGFIYANF